jgi:hypothetical protein
MAGRNRRVPVVACVPTSSDQESKQGASRSIRGVAKSEVCAAVGKAWAKPQAHFVCWAKCSFAPGAPSRRLPGQMQRKRATGIASAQVQPNPSVNARPNIKSPGPRGGAGLSSTARARAFAVGLRVTSNVRLHISHQGSSRERKTFTRRDCVVAAPSCCPSQQSSLGIG